MLSIDYIIKVGRLIYQTETQRTGTYYGVHIGGGPSCSYGEPPHDHQEQRFKKKKSRSIDEVVEKVNQNPI